jgi:ribosome biogenesis GTPase A
MQVQWFPGHMAKTIRKIKEGIARADVVLEILDARIPSSSRNPMIEKIVESRPVLIILNKADLADAEVLKTWEQYFRSENTEVIQVSALTGKNITGIIEKSRYLCRNTEWAGKRAVRAMIIGVPNVGKSAILNYLAGKKKQDVSNRPGVTREVKKIRVSGTLHLIDTPGVLWHKFEDPETGEKLAILGSVRDSILNRDEIAVKALELLKEYYPLRISERYGLTEESVRESLPSQLLEAIGRRRGCLVAGGKVDPERAAGILLTELRDGRLGGICLDRVEKKSST